MLAAETDSVDVMHLFAQTLAMIVNGEITQMFSAAGWPVERIITAVSMPRPPPCSSWQPRAALLSPVDAKVVKSVRSFGYDIGMAFQIVDDILDFIGEQTTVGKPVASDLRQGLVTLPALYYFESNPEDPELKAILAGQLLNDERMNRLVSAIRMSGAIQQAASEARHSVDCAWTLMEQPESVERDALQDLAEYIVHRPL
jgi:geranylgeranyl pyrophosphate synthase